ncbi:MFS transporter [Streptomyces sp. NPDC059355]|uniref:MFS transporter n=1 Tax=Streptomyces sp. NPDC059355 TaxID=3346811 RepID=UPI0036811581
MALIISVFPAQRRGTAMGVWGMVAGLATLPGPTLGGIPVSTVGRRWILLANVPIGVASLVLTYLVVPDMRNGRSRTFDLVGVADAGGVRVPPPRRSAGGRVCRCVNSLSWQGLLGFLIAPCP